MCCDERADLRLSEALLIILECLGGLLAEEYILTAGQTQPLLEPLFNHLSDILRKPLLSAGVAA